MLSLEDNVLELPAVLDAARRDPMPLLVQADADDLKPLGGVARVQLLQAGEESLLVYLTDRFYNPRDEGRIPFNDPSINYDWETQKK